MRLEAGAGCEVPEHNLWNSLRRKSLAAPDQLSVAVNLAHAVQVVFNYTTLWRKQIPGSMTVREIALFGHIASFEGGS